MRTTYQQSRTVVTQEGEIIQEETFREIVIPKEPDFVKLYLNDVMTVAEMPGWVTGILYELLKRMNYENEIILNASVKKRISDETGKAVGSIDNALYRFVKKGILIRKGTGTYLANPYLFAKGSWDKIHRIRMSVVYEQGRKIVSAEIEHETDATRSRSDETKSLTSFPF